MDILHNTTDLQNAVAAVLDDIPFPSIDADRVHRLLSRCPKAAETPLRLSADLAGKADVAEVWVKDERARMGLGSFKALGAAYVIARDAEAGQAQGRVYVTASAGNHGLSVAAGAAAFGARAIIFLADTVPEAFAMRLRDMGAEVRRHGAIYEESMSGAAAFAAENDHILLSDSSWPGYVTRPLVLMEGYLALMQEVTAQMREQPTHIFLQAGVGGLAAASAAYARHVWGASPRIIVVEPDAAPALFASMQVGAPQVRQGPASDMGRLDCKEPSLIALKGLARDADDFMLITEADGQAAAVACADAGLASTPSGAAGVAGLLAACRDRADFGLSRGARVLVILSEMAT